MSKRTALVTGGCGFIGSHLVDRLVSEGYFVRVFDNLSAGKLENIQGHLDSGAVEFVKGDVRSPRSIRKAIKDVDYVFHLAAKISVPWSVKHPSKTFNVNVSGTVHLLRICHQARVKQNDNRRHLLRACQYKLPVSLCLARLPEKHSHE